MAQKKEKKFWIDPRLIRPRGWSPPKPTAQIISREYAMADESQKPFLLAIRFSSLPNEMGKIYYCHLFYTDNISPSVIIGDHYHPWRIDPYAQEAILGMLSYIEGDFHNICEIWLNYILTFEDLNDKLAKTFAIFFGLPFPSTEQDYMELCERIEIYRKENGAVWCSFPDFQPLISQFEQSLRDMYLFFPKIKTLTNFYSNKVSPDAWNNYLGLMEINQRIENASNQPSHKRAINMLNKALEKNPNTNQSSEIYMELGFRYSMLGEIEQAIENYTKSVENNKIFNPLIYYWRGELYYHQQCWDKALHDFEQAISLEIYSPELEQAQQYVKELQELRKSN